MLQDLWDSIREKMQDLIDSISDILPAGSTIPIISGVAILMALIAILNTAGAGKTAGSLEDSAMKYKAGQQQINSVLGSKEEIGFSEESEEIIGRTNLVLQYKDLAELPSDAGISKMEKALNVDDEAVADENSDYDNSMIDQIVDFAGDYGGVMVATGTTSNSNIKLAAFSSQAKMKTTADGVSNVLYEKINRTIAGKKYGDSATKNSLVILSSSKINGMQQISKGSVMYSLFGDSTGTKTRGKYVCTGIEPGEAMDDITEEDTEDTLDTESDEDYTSSDNSSVSNNTSKSSSKTYTSQDNEELDSEISTTTSSSESEEEEATIVPHTDGNGVVVITDDDTVYSGGAYNNDGSVNDEWIKENADDESDSEDDEEVSNSSSSSSSSSSYSSEDNIGYTDKSKSIATKILGQDGKPLTENTTADLILYQYDSGNGSVIISYWNYSTSETATSAMVSED